MTKRKSPSPTPPRPCTCGNLDAPHRVRTDEGLRPICDGCLRAWQRTRKAKGAEVRA